MRPDSVDIAALSTARDAKNQEPAQRDTQNCSAFPTHPFPPLVNLILMAPPRRQGEKFTIEKSSAFPDNSGRAKCPQEYCNILSWIPTGMPGRQDREIYGK